jgi:hypothetical protein
VALPLLLTGAVVACGKSVDRAERAPSSEDPIPNGSVDPGPLPTATPIACGSDQVERWTFTQPQPQVKGGKVDLLFVVDTSSSLARERARVAGTVPAFVAALDPRVDYRIAVMLAHGSASARSGRLFAASGDPLVLDSQRLSVAQIQAKLGSALAAASLADADQANGEAMMLSLLNGLKPNRLAQSRAAGFFRADAALSVVLLSDENDVCYPPELHGYAQFPDYVASSPAGYERKAYDRYCAGADPVTPERVRQALQSLQGGRKLSLGAITHVDPARVPPAMGGSEDAIGHGLIELLQRGLDSVLMEIEDYSYDVGLKKLGEVISSQLNLLTEFALGDPTGLVADSVSVAVDGHVVPAVFDAASGKVTIGAADAGGAGSIVEVQACRN